MICVLVNVGKRCNETVNVRAGDQGYVIIHNSGDEIQHCQTTLKSTTDDVISMRFMVNLVINNAP